MSVMMRQQKQQIERYTRKRRFEDLKSCIRICIYTLYIDNGMDDKEVCNATGLSLSTVYRLYNEQFSLSIRFGTVQALAAAAGYKISLESGTARIAVVD